MPMLLLHARLYKTLVESGIRPAWSGTTWPDFVFQFPALLFWVLAASLAWSWVLEPYSQLALRLVGALEATATDAGGAAAAGGAVAAAGGAAAGRAAAASRAVLVSTAVASEGDGHDWMRAPVAAATPLAGRVYSMRANTAFIVGCCAWWGLVSSAAIICTFYARNLVPLEMNK